MQLSPALESLPRNSILAFYGGSFDPPHIAHQAIIMTARRELNMDALIVMMAYQNPLKPPPRFPHSLRLSWMKQICDEANEAYPSVPVILSDYEVRNGILFTYKSVQYLKNLIHPKKIYLLLGTDNLTSLREWEGYEELRSSVEFVFVKRSGFVYNNADFKELIIDVPEHLSSSFIRQEKNIDGLYPYLVPSTAVSILKALKEQ